MKGVESLFICVLMRLFIGKECQNVMRMRMLVVHGMHINYRFSLQSIKFVVSFPDPTLRVGVRSGTDRETIKFAEALWHA